MISPNIVKEWRHLTGWFGSFVWRVQDKLCFKSLHHCLCLKQGSCVYIDHQSKYFTSFSFREIMTLYLNIDENWGFIHSEGQSINMLQTDAGNVPVLLNTTSHLCMDTGETLSPWICSPSPDATATVSAPQQRIWKRRQITFSFLFARVISCCCFRRTSSRLMQPPVKTHTHTGGLLLCSRW